MIDKYLIEKYTSLYAALAALENDEENNQVMIEETKLRIAEIDQFLERAGLALYTTIDNEFGIFVLRERKER